MKINLHTHSKYSLDGEFEIKELLDILKRNKFDVISITDHNTCMAYKDINDGLDMQIITGLEADAIVNNHTYDFLCYGFNLNEITNYTAQRYETVGKRQRKVFDALVEKCNNANIELNNIESYNPVNEYAHAAIYRMLNKDFLEKHNISSANDLYRISTIDLDFPLYIDMHIVWPDINELVEVIHANQGKVFLAHPYRYNKNVLEVLNDVKEYVDGIEIANNNSKEEIDFLYKFAKKNNLLISCGSDYHGNDRYSIECGDLSKEMEQDILNWINNKINIESEKK